MFNIEAQQVYDHACEYMRARSLESEVLWQRNANFADFSEQQLLTESAWVILCSGFREATVRRTFDHICLSFCDFESAEIICREKSICVKAARASINNPAKLKAICACAELVCSWGFAAYKQKVSEDPVAHLQMIPFIGPVTVWHLAKNLGLDVAKPDRHMIRLASRLGFVSAAALCEELAYRNNEQVKVVDLILWRYLAASAKSKR